MGTNRTYPGGAAWQEPLIEVQRRAVRKLTKNGNSITVSIPVEFMHALNLLPGDEVVEIYDPVFEGFVVRPVRPRRVPSSPSAAQEPSRV